MPARATRHYLSVRHSCPHARHDTAHMESGASLDPQVSVLCVWRLPPPKGSRSVRHEPHATQGPVSYTHLTLPTIYSV